MFKMNLFAYFIIILSFLEQLSCFIICMSILTLSTTYFLNLYKLSAREVFETPKNDPLVPKVMI